MQSVLSTGNFARQAKRVGLTDTELMEIEAVLASNPTVGDVMAGTGGARKMRFAGKQGGKSGGYRTIHYYGGDDVPVFLLDIFSKGDKANLTKAARNVLADVLPTLADHYRASVRQAVKENRK
jgi:hypothetical protein